MKIPKYQDTKIPKATKRYEKFMSNKYQKIYKSLGINTKINTKRYNTKKYVNSKNIIYQNTKRYNQTTVNKTNLNQYHSKNNIRRILRIY